MTMTLRRILIWLFISMLPLQGVRAIEHMSEASSAQLMSTALEEAQVVQHWFDHERGVLHHHDEDGSVHYDDSDASYDHTGGHMGGHLHGLPHVVLSFTWPVPSGSRPVGRLEGSRPDPFLDKPPRPPHQAS